MSFFFNLFKLYNLFISQVNVHINVIYQNVDVHLYNYQIYNSIYVIMMHRLNVQKIVLFIVIYVEKDLQRNQVYEHIRQRSVMYVLDKLMYFFLLVLSRFCFHFSCRNYSISRLVSSSTNFFSFKIFNKWLFQVNFCSIMKLQNLFLNTHKQP